MSRSQEEQLADARKLYEFHSETDNSEVHADFILAAGSHDLRVADHAAQLFNEGCAPLLVCSGGYGKVTSGIWANPEAVVYAERCRELGVPCESIVVETSARNTGDNFTFTKRLLADRAIFPTTGIIVCKPYMAKRAWATGSKQWREVLWFVRPPQISFEDYPDDDTPLHRMINLMVGDLQRLKTYADKGFQVPVPVPEAVWAAHHRLVCDGYTDYLV